MTEAQPGPLESVDAESRQRADNLAEQSAEARPEYVGDLPDDPEQAVDMPTGGAASDETGAPRQDSGEDRR